MSFHSNIELIQQGYAAFSQGKLPALMALISEEAVWYSPGHNPLSGEYRGHEAIAGYFTKFATLSQGTFQTELIDVFANETGAVALTRDTASCNGKVFSWEGGVIFTLQSHQLITAKAFNFDQTAVDQFWLELSK